MTRKILLSVLVIGALLVAVAGITMAVFSDNVASDEQWFDAGTVDIVVNEDEDDYFETKVHMENMEPGDSDGPQLISIYNAGTLPVFYHIWTYTSGDIFSCDPNPACNMQVYTDGFTGDYALGVGETETMNLNTLFPLCAGNLCQDKDGYFQMFIHSWQQSNMEGYTCVKLEDKDDITWMPDPLSDPHGNVCYKAIDTGTNGLTDALHIVTNGYGLTDDEYFQLALDGGDVNDPNDGSCTAQDIALAGMDTTPDYFVSGYYNWGTTLMPTCDSVNGGEGVWNYAGVYGGVHSVGGAISYEATLDLLPMDYIVKANVKEIIGAPPFPGGGSWPSVLSGLDYLSFTIEE